MPFQQELPHAHFENLTRLSEDYWWYQNRIQMILSLLQNISLDRPNILDLGCGPGIILQSLSKKLNASTAVGVDASDSAAKAFAQKGITFVQQDLSKPDNSTIGTFDLALTNDVLEHLPNESPLIATAHRCLKPGGFFLASVPGLPSLYSSWDKKLGHYRRYTRDSLSRVIQQSGFQIRRATYAFAYSVPPALVYRFLHRYSDEDCLFPKLPHFLNRSLIVLGDIEASLASKFSIPFGLSVFVLAQKTG